MYLVPAEKYRSPAKRRRCRTKLHPHTEWIKLRTKHREAELQRNARTEEIADYMQQILPAATISQLPTADKELPKLKKISRRGTQSTVTSASDSAPQIRPSKEIIYETPKHEPLREDDDDDDNGNDVEFLEEDAKSFGRENVGSVASP